MVRETPIQAAAVPFRFTEDGEMEVLLVTTSTGRWTAPKGLIEDGHTPGETARIEALEEAGVIGAVAGRELGAYESTKEGVTFQVRVFALRVERVLEKWQEDGERERRWTTPKDAAALVASEDLGRIILAFARQNLRAKPAKRKRA